MLNVSFDAWSWQIYIQRNGSGNIQSKQKKNEMKTCFFLSLHEIVILPANETLMKKNWMKNNNKKLLKDIQNCSNNDGKYGNI